MSEFGKTIWDGDKNEFIGRTAGSWAKIGLFYLVFYSCLAGFFAAMLQGFFTTVDIRTPSMTDMYSLIKQNPGMGYRPRTATDSTLIKFNQTESVSRGEQVLNIFKFLKAEKYIDDNYNVINISADGDGKPAYNLPVNHMADCNMDLNHLNDSFGYMEGKPCVLLKLNRVINWVPKPFDNDTIKTHMGQEALAKLGDRLDPDYVGVTCEGENDADQDNLGEVEFFPSKGFPVIYYPYSNAEDYRPPLVFAKFSGAKKGVIIQVWCKLWVANIKHHKNDKGGSVHFELLIDSNKLIDPISNVVVENEKVVDPPSQVVDPPSEVVDPSN
jgi:sodium/potassium-transporting ATPase subunit beta